MKPKRFVKIQFDTHRSFIVDFWEESKDFGTKKIVHSARFYNEIGNGDNFTHVIGEFINLGTAPVTGEGIKVLT